MQKNGLIHMNINLKNQMRVGAILFFLLVSTSFFAQKTRNPDAAWSSIAIGLKFNDKWSDITDFGYRTISSEFIPYTYYARTAMRYNINKRWNAAGGIAFYNQKTSYLKENHEYGTEFRIYEEINRSSLKSHKVIFNQRFRIEQKFYQATSKKPPTQYLRAQYRIMTGYQFSSKMNIQAGPEWFESYQNKKIVFDQLRLYTTLNVSPGDGFGISLSFFKSIRSTTYQNIYQIQLSKNLQLHEQQH